MPAKKQTTKESIVKAAFELVRKEGMSALNMRTVAKMCNCSTQPIYLSFKGGAEELKGEVAKLIAAEFNNCIDKEIALKQYPEYKSIGMAYVRFAIEEKELFKYLFMRERGSEGDLTGSFDKSTYIIMQNYGLYKEEAATLHTEMWVFVHGIATMIATGYLNWNMETVSEMISDVYLGLLAKFQQGDKK